VGYAFVAKAHTCETVTADGIWAEFERRPLRTATGLKQQWRMVSDMTALLRILRL
jgi:hypothetical protein